jgi:hypothetical protein
MRSPSNSVAFFLFPKATGVDFSEIAIFSDIAKEQTGIH